MVSNENLADGGARKVYVVDTNKLGITADELVAMLKNEGLSVVRADPSANERFFLSTDNDSHWYLVPVARQAEWDAWCDIPEDDERAWQAPAFAVPIGGAPSLVTFERPDVGAF